MNLGIVYVTSSHKEPFSARWDGQDYVFEPGVALPIPAGAAQHIFSYGLEDKLRTFVRHGIIKTGADMAIGHAWLGKFSFEEPELTPPAKVPKAAKQAAVPATV